MSDPPVQGAALSIVVLRKAGGSRAGCYATPTRKDTDLKCSHGKPIKSCTECMSMAT